MKSILVTNIEWENSQPMRHVAILIRVDMHLDQSIDYIIIYNIDY